MRYLLSFLITLTAITFTACSSKEVYEPKHVVDDWKNSGTINTTIENVSQNAALLEDRKVLVDGKILDITIPEDDKLLGFSDGWIISAKIDGKLKLQSIKNSSEAVYLDLKKTIATASTNGDILAILFTDNEMALYSIAKRSAFLKEQGDAPIVVNSKIITPHFEGDLVLFSTLDGKVVIVNTKLKKKLRTIIVSSEEYFNNIIYFNLVDNKILAATGHKILSYAQKEIRVKYDIRSVVNDDSNVFITTKQGEVVSLTPELEQVAKVKFPFAHFLGMIATSDKLYVLEKAGYLIEMSKDLLKYSVYDVNVDDGYIFIGNNKFYVNDEYISVE